MKPASVLRAAVAAALSVAAGHAAASGFALIEQNASGLGNAYAGAAAAAEDASTIFFNPAGLTRIPGRSVVVAGHLIAPSAKFRDGGSTGALQAVPPSLVTFPMNGPGSDAGDFAVVPNMYLSWQLSDRMVAGVGVTVPFGLKTDYDAGWLGRFHALRSEVKTLNINPTIAFKVNDAFSVGFGVSWQKMQAELTKAVNYSFVASSAGIPGAAAGVEGSNMIKGDDSAWGFNFGLMFHPTAATSIGLAYRSAIAYKLSGVAEYYGRPAALTGAASAVAALANQVGDSRVVADVKLPANFSIAFKHQLNRRWDVLADATWTGWSTVKNLDIIRTSGIAAGANLESTPFNWRDTWRVGLGVNYRPNQVWTLRAGIAYDQSPVPDTFRTPRVPDQDRTWLAVGAQYKLSKAGTIDAGYAHLFVKDARMSLTGPPTISAAAALGRGNLIGTADSKVDILSVQYRHNF